MAEHLKRAYGNIKPFLKYANDIKAGEIALSVQMNLYLICDESDAEKLRNDTVNGETHFSAVLCGNCQVKPATIDKEVDTGIFFLCEDCELPEGNERK